MTQTEKKLHFYITKAIADYKMLQKDDKVMICLSGGKDSFTLVKVMHDLVANGTYDLDLIVYNFGSITTRLGMTPTFDSILKTTISITSLKSVTPILS